VVSLPEVLAFFKHFYEIQAGNIAEEKQHKDSKEKV
jgi:hypothetical protein